MQRQEDLTYKEEEAEHRMLQIWQIAEGNLLQKEIETKRLQDHIMSQDKQAEGNLEQKNQELKRLQDHLINQDQ